MPRTFTRIDCYKTRTSGSGGDGTDEDEDG